MVISLQKGQQVPVPKRKEGFTLGLGWDPPIGQKNMDLDCSVILLGPNEKVSCDEDLVFYNNLHHPSGSVIHHGDNRNGLTYGDDERVDIHIQKIPRHVTKIIFLVTIHTAGRVNFGMVPNSFIRLCEGEKETYRFDLANQQTTATSMLFGELQKVSNEWVFVPQGIPFVGGLKALCQNVGINI